MKVYFQGLEVAACVILLLALTRRIEAASLVSMSCIQDDVLPMQR